ncbi:MAG: MBL fold metallo-hydrolase [Caldisericia bacterium]
MINIDKIVVTPFKTNCYFVYDKNSGIIIDPGGDCQLIVNKLNELKKIKFEAIFNTHGHADHTFCNKFLKEKYNLKIFIHKKDAFFLSKESINKIWAPNFKEVEPDYLLDDNEQVDLKGFKIKIFHTEGHTPGSVMFILKDIIFSGDTIFKGTIGRTDFEFGNSNKMKESLIKILNNLNNDYKIYPGHGSLTTLNEEIENIKYFIDII